MKNITSQKKLMIAMLAIPTAEITLSPVVQLQGVVTILASLFIVDFFSGLAASYCEWSEITPPGKYFFGQSGGFSSDKFKKSILKGIIYGGFPLIVIKFQQVFLIKTFSFNSITDLQIDITTVCLLLFSANELYSIFWENLPKCGLNIPKMIKNLILGVKEVSNEIKNK